MEPNTDIRYSAPQSVLALVGTVPPRGGCLGTAVCTQCRPAGIRSLYGTDVCVCATALWAMHGAIYGATGVVCAGERACVCCNSNCMWTGGAWEVKYRGPLGHHLAFEPVGDGSRSASREG